MSEGDLWLRFGVSLTIGVLVGMQRQRQDEVLAGIRTFALAALLGTICGVLAVELGGIVLMGGFLAVAVTMGIGRYADREREQERGDGGITTEIALLLVFALGAWLARGPLAPAVVVGATAFVLLYAKQVLHGWTKKLEERDWKIIARFILVSCVILPILPDKTYGPFDVLNPRETWLMVVLIVGLGMVGFVIEKMFGERVGVVAAGLLGGLVSSTATTVTYAKAARERGGYATATLIIMLASTVVYVRLLISTAVAAPEFGAVRLPLGIMGAVSSVLAFSAYWQGRKGEHEKHAQANPGQFRTAFVFAALYALIAFGTTSAKHFFGDAGVYVVGAISGLTDLDAITLSTSRLVATQRLAEDDAWRVIVIAVASNLAFKSGLVYALGKRPLFLRAGLMMLGSAVVGVVLVLIWP